jgi:hypothetical protein
MAALVGVPANLRAVLAAHVALQFVDGRCFRTSDNVERDGLMRFATQAFDFKVQVAGVQASPSADEG